jgi:hypothetical protein
MADAIPVFKVGDTEPPLRLSVTDHRGQLIDFTTADEMTLFAESGAGTITGPCEPIDPPEISLDEDRREIELNVRYEWDPADTARANIGTYDCEVYVVWDAGRTRRETYPNGENGIADYFRFAIAANKQP